MEVVNFVEKKKEKKHRERSERERERERWKYISSLHTIECIGGPFLFFTHVFFFNSFKSRIWSLGPGSWVPSPWFLVPGPWSVNQWLLPVVFFRRNESDGRWYTCLVANHSHHRNPGTTYHQPPTLNLVGIDPETTYLYPGTALSSPPRPWIWSVSIQAQLICTLALPYHQPPALNLVGIDPGTTYLQ